MMITGGCIATVIPLALALIFQKWISMGLTSGAVKKGYESAKKGVTVKMV